jgi:hypothetical protein
MPGMERTPTSYVKVLAARKKTSSPISRGYQVTGLMLAELLRDRTHKHLYLKLAREYDNGALLTLARDVAERKSIGNYGAYFMRRFQQTKSTMRRTASPRRTQRRLPLRKKRTTRNG